MDMRRKNRHRHQWAQVLLLIGLAAPIGLAAQTPAVTDHIQTVLVPGGSFMMGNPSGAKAEQPVHQVTLASFLEAITPVTVAQFRQFVEKTGYLTSVERNHNGQVLQDLSGNGVHSPSFLTMADASWSNPYYQLQPDFPVSLISWYDAIAFCNWRSAVDGLAPAYRVKGTSVQVNWAAKGWRLPTEAEWEYAARGGPELGPPTLPVPPRTSTAEMSWYYDTTPRPHPVGLGKANSLGLYDLGGNVTEWCWDWYDDYQGKSQVNPHGPDLGDFKVTRAGAWFQNWYQPIMNPSNRFSEEPEASVFCYEGFRLVRNP